METCLQLARLLELLHVALALERAASREEDILVVLIDVLRPRRQPRHGLVVNDLLPFARNVRRRDRSSLTNVDSHILRTNTELASHGNRISTLGNCIKIHE